MFHEELWIATVDLARINYGNGWMYSITVRDANGNNLSFNQTDKSKIENMYREILKLVKGAS